MKKNWNTPKLFSLSIEETNSGNTTYWNETCLQENLSIDRDQGTGRRLKPGYETLQCGKYGGSQYFGREDDQGSQVIPPPNAAAAGS